MSKALFILGLLTIGTLCGFLLLNSQKPRPLQDKLSQKPRPDQDDRLNEVSLKRDLFKQWKVVMNKEYATPEEEEKRFQIWSDNYDFVQSRCRHPNQKPRPMRFMLVFLYYRFP